MTKTSPTGGPTTQRSLGLLVTPPPSGRRGTRSGYQGPPRSKNNHPAEDLKRLESVFDRLGEKKVDSSVEQKQEEDLIKFTPPKSRANHRVVSYNRGGRGAKSPANHVCHRVPDTTDTECGTSKSNSLTEISQVCFLV